LRNVIERAVLLERTVFVVTPDHHAVIRETAAKFLGGRLTPEGADFAVAPVGVDVDQAETPADDARAPATERRIKAAKFLVVKSLETFDYLAIPSLNKKLVVELARCEWIGRRENVLALGNSGTGKTHIALALGLAACQRGLRVRFTTAAALVVPS
jgi:chromosomal replication initiation ATPase DnaA